MRGKHLIVSGMAITLGLSAALSLTAKRPLGHDDFDGWLSVKSVRLADNGRWVAYTVAPQQGDDTLTFADVKSARRITLPRGYKPSFTADGRWAVALIKPPYADTRNAKIKKKKGFDLPQDSLAIVDLADGRIEKIGNVTDFTLGKDAGHWLAYRSCDTLMVKPKDLKDDKLGRPLVMRDLDSPASRTVKWVKDYTMSDNGRRIAFSLSAPDRDSVYTDGVAFVNFPDTSMILIDRDKPYYSAPVFDEAGCKLAYLSSTDTVATGTKQCLLCYADLDAVSLPSAGIIEPEEIAMVFPEYEPVNLYPPHSDDPEEQARLEREAAEAKRQAFSRRLALNQYSVPRFSHNGSRIVVGVAPVVAPDDTTIVDFERAGLDIWRWDAPYTPPQEKVNADKARKHTFPVVVDLDRNFSYRLLTADPLVKVEGADRWDGDWALLRDPSADIVSRQWNYLAPEYLRLVNVRDGRILEAGKAAEDNSWLSPAGRYLLYYDNGRYRCYDIEKRESRCISDGVPYPLYDEDDDHPMARQPYGVASWSDGDREVMVYDRHDIWCLDPSGVREPYCLTAGDGRRNDRRYRYLRLDEEERSVAPGSQMMLEVFGYADKRAGYASVKAGASSAPRLSLLEEASFGPLRKARKADVYAFTKGRFEVIPDLWVATSRDLGKAAKLTDVDACRSDILWGTSQLVKWEGYDGTPLEGVLYLPENFDPQGSYPLLTVFYERAGDDLYRHYEMQPSWSWVNYPFYVSRGYVVFVPDIRYHAGLPGEDAYNCVCSGVEYLCDKYPAIDRKRIGIDGQSWGGYQTAYLITRTDMFACAGSGAPVANMTSAFGGIRWGSGDSRQAQYEMGQSRIGRNLWEAPELYIANSPLFAADRIHTPLLIMHNDADGAVPWYQGIELFMALRRLQKPVWMLQYNGEAHNIKERRNRKDITIRLQQFFDHYLKGDPMPRWMREGVPYTRKGQDLGID